MWQRYQGIHVRRSLRGTLSDDGVSPDPAASTQHRKHRVGKPSRCREDALACESSVGQLRCRRRQVEGAHRGDDHRVPAAVSQRGRRRERPRGDCAETRSGRIGAGVVLDEAGVSGQGVGRLVDEAVEQHMECTDPREVRAVDRFRVIACQRRIGGCGDQRECAERGGGGRRGLPPRQSALGRRVRSRPGSELVVSRLTAVDACLIGDHARRRVGEPARDDGTAWKRPHRGLARVHEQVEIAAIVRAPVMAVVRGVGCAGTQRDAERLVQRAPVREGSRGWLLGKRVDVVVRRLERDVRAHHRRAVPQRRERGERRRALQVPALRTVRVERDLAQHGIRDRFGAATPPARVPPHERIHRQPIADGGIEEDDRRPQASPGDRAHGDSLPEHRKLVQR